MVEIDPLTGLPKELGISEVLSKEQQVIVVRKDKRKFGKTITVIQGFSKDVDLKALTKKLKQRFACGGTYTKESIELQGDHTAKMKEALVDLGFNADNITVE